MLFTVASELLLTGFSTKRRNGSAARHADVFVGNSRAEPMSLGMAQEQLYSCGLMV